jgi:phenylacetic acid degradation operon negative regulatory protein
MENSRGETVKTILQNLAEAGEFLLFAMQPRPISAFRREVNRYSREKLFGSDKNNGKKFYNAFYSLRKRGLVKVVYRGNQMHIYLTDEGKKKAGKYKINDLKIKTAKKWDGKWRILIFDIANKQGTKREALRGKIKELGLYQLQKSVWVCPYEFAKEMQLLRDFFGLEPQEMKIITAIQIEDDAPLRQYFHIT